jgi:hypothetical protein
MLNSNQHMLAQVTKDHYLEQSSEAPDEGENHEKNLSKLVGYTISQPIDRSLLKRVLGSKRASKVEDSILARSNETRTVFPTLNETVTPVLE